MILVASRAMVRTVALVVALVAAVLGGVACAGSSSETPWPPEPADVDLGPAGEDRASSRPSASPSVSPADSAAPAPTGGVVAAPPASP